MYQAVREQLGLDQPIPVQYVKWLGPALQGDFGHSIRTREPALDGLLARLPITLELSVLAMAVSLLIAIPIGILSHATQFQTGPHRNAGRYDRGGRT
jgi:ABC-type dipeptide/oligopeptide/nickel transport system permease component